MPLVQCPDCGKQISDSAPACIHCGRPRDAVGPNSLLPSPIQPTSSHNVAGVTPPATDKQASTTVEEYGAQYGFGWFLLIVGIGCVIFSLNMDASVGYGAYDRVNNIGLMNDKQNYLIASSVMAVLGVILIVTAKKHTVERISSESLVDVVGQNQTQALSSEEIQRRRLKQKEDEDNQNAEQRMLLTIVGSFLALMVIGVTAWAFFSG